MNRPVSTLPLPTYRVQHERPPRLWAVVVLLVCSFLGVALLWASLAEIDEISRAEGRVISSSKTQVIQSAESGVILDILVRPGEQVRVGQLLVKLDETTTSSSAGEVQARVHALKAQVARLRLESEGGGEADFVCPATVLSAVPSICANEINLMRARQLTLAQSKQVLASRIEQRQRELNEARSNQTRLVSTNELAVQKLALVEPMAERRLVSQTEFLNARQAVADSQGELEVVRESIARLEAALGEARLQADQAELQFRQDSLAELTQRLAELSSAEEQLRGASDRVTRTEIRSPVDGVVNSLAVNTVGGFVTAGERLLDIVPLEEVLLIEARLKPSDVAFILPGQQANIKFTAYDFSIFGGLHGRVQNVSADSIIDPNTRETYYVVLIETGASALEFNGRSLPILPGMVANVEILTGKKTILQYLMKPINKARDEALRER